LCITSSMFINTSKIKYLCSKIFVAYHWHVLLLRLSIAHALLNKTNAESGYLMNGWTGYIANKMVQKQGKKKICCDAAPSIVQNEECRNAVLRCNDSGDA
jgi:hypothetical protein